jgi:hypothetical protein
METTLDMAEPVERGPCAFGYVMPRKSGRRRNRTDL